MTLGRVNRSQYFARLFFYGTSLFISCLLFLLPLPTFGKFIVGCAALAAILYNTFGILILQIKRLHDINASGWWALLLLVPIVNAIYKLVLLFKKGTPRRNRFGPKPCITKLESWMIPISLILWLLALIIITFRGTSYLQY